MNDLLMYIDRIDQSVNDSEISVLEAMIQSYDKSIMIITEASDDTDLSVFDVFQEGEKWDKFKEDTKAPVLGKKGEGVIKRFLMLIPRLIQKLFVMMKKLFTKNKNIEQKMEKDIQTLKSKANKKVKAPLTPEQINAIKKMFEDKPPKNDPEQKKDNQKVLNELEKMVRDTDKSLVNIGNMVDKIDQKNPGLIDEILNTLGAPPREEIPLYQKTLKIIGSTLFFQSIFNSLSDPIAVHGDFGNFAVNIPELGYSQQGDINKLIEYTNHANNYIKYIDEHITSITKGVSERRNAITVKFGDAIRVVERMKEEFDKNFEHLNADLKRLDAAFPKFKELEKELEERFENEVQSDNFNPDTSLIVKESEALSKYLTALTTLQMKLDLYCKAVLHRWNVDYQKIMDAIDRNETHIELG